MHKLNGFKIKINACSLDEDNSIVVRFNQTATLNT